MSKRPRKPSRASPSPARKQKATLSLTRYTKKKAGLNVKTKTGRYRGVGSPINTLENEDLYDAARRHLGQQTRKLSSIKVGKRHRKDFGDLAQLVRSINERGGLLHPIVVTPKNQLIAGERRLRAWPLSKFRKDPIPVTVIDIDKVVAGEWDENAVRKDFTPSEAVDIARELEPRLRAEAKQRQRDHGKTTKGRQAKAIADKGEAGEKVARAVGKSRRTLEKAKDIVEATEQDPKNKRLAKLRADMDRTGRVDGPHKRLQIIRQTERIRKAPPGVPMKGPYSVVSIDFPWPNEPDMSQDELDARGRSLRPYPAMSIKAGCTFMADQVAPILAKDCVVYFWTTNFHMPYAFHLLQALGFRTHSTIGTWCKDKMGRGQILRDKTEHCIVAIKGKPVINLTNQTTDWHGEGWQRRENSQKPDAFYALVEELTPAPRYAEIFSRGGRNSKWDCHGDEIGKYPAMVQLPMPMPMPIAEPPARPAEDLPAVNKDELALCRSRMQRDFPEFSTPGHTVTFSVDGDDHLGSCSCGEAFVFPHADNGRHMDLAVELHLRRALDAAAHQEIDQLDIPGFLKRPAPEEQIGS